MTGSSPSPSIQQTLLCAGHLSRRWQKVVIRSVLVTGDLASILGGLLLALYVRYGTIRPVELPFQVPGQTIGYRKLSFVIAPIWLLVLYFEGLYDLDRLFWGSKEFTRVGRAVALGILSLIIASFAFKLPGLSRFWLIASAILVTVFICASRLAIREGIHWARRRGKMCLRTLLIGYNAETLSLLEVLKKDRSSGLVPVGYVGRKAQALSEDVELPRLGRTGDIARVVDSNDIDTILIASSAFGHERIGRLIQCLRGVPVDIHVSSGFFDVMTSRVLVREISGTPLLTVKGIGLSKTAEITKRTFDLVVSTVSIVLTLPFWVTIVAAIKLTSKGPALYLQERVGRGGRHFMMYKFRSMVEGADKMQAALEDQNEADGLIFKIKEDPRITKVGRWLRRFSIDEAPQVLNVIKGQMSLIGPRPPVPGEVADYKEWHFRRLEVTPGMTGLWQISGRSNLSFDDMVKLDLFYIENWSLGLDASILLRTIPAVIRGVGAY